MRRLAFAIAGSLLAFTITAHAADGEVVKSELHNFRITTIADGFKDPWSIAFLPDGEILVTERIGQLRAIRGGKLDPTPIAGVPKVRYMGQGGLSEVVPHPQFASNRLLYISYAKPSADGSQGTTAVIRARYDGKALTDVREIFEAKAWSTAGQHYAGKLLLDGKGHLFITVGDRVADPHLGARHPAQSLMSHQGKVIRLNEDGSVPRDNPFVGRSDALPEIWSYGHRNAQGLVMHPATGEIFATEHGPQGGDELNLIQPGKNYGWPVIGYGVNYGGERIHASREAAGFEQPLQYWVPSIAPSGLMFYTGDKFPKWNGNLFIGALAGRHVARLNLENANGGYEVESLEGSPLLAGLDRVRDVRQGPDGYIYLALDDRRGGGLTSVVRLEPAP